MSLVFPRQSFLLVTAHMLEGPDVLDAREWTHILEPLFRVVWGETAEPSQKKTANFLKITWLYVIQTHR